MALQIDVPSRSRPRRRSLPPAGSSPSVVRPLLKPVNTLGWTPKEKKITILARKSWNVLLHLAQDQGLDKEVFSTTLSQVVRGIDYGSNDLELIKKHLRGMVSTTVEWQSPTAGEGGYWTVCGLLSHAKLTKVRGEIWVEWSYAVNMRQELLEPRVFARLQLPILSQLRTHAGLALYEICTRYKDIGRTARQSWHWWRPVLTGRPENEKTARMEYRVFKRDCLRLAIAEVSAVTDIEVELVEYKAGRFISDLQFLVRAKSQDDLPEIAVPRPVDVASIERAIGLGIDGDRAEALLEEFGEPALVAGLDALERRIASGFPEPLRDLYRYLKSLMPGEARRVQMEQATQVAKADPHSAVSRNLQATRHAKWNEQWLRERRGQVIEEIQALSVEAQNDLEAALLEDMERRNVHPSIRKRLQTSGWEHQIVIQDMVRYYAQATHGPQWDQPTDRELLEVAARLGGTVD
ncbi:RepB family plasmid replication initiator protein [Variovorax sp. PvP013]|uniref:RepB family plasmid replication initiator protein n=1 Tax=Variovorax sp. PvP013 TaxID=3156435 RepID=UPI003D25376C